MELLPSQRVELFKIISEKGFNITDFDQFISRTTDIQKNKLDIIRYKFNDSFYFRIGLISSQFRIECSPYINKLRAIIKVSEWSKVTQRFIYWLDSIKKESEMLDMWDKIKKGIINDLSLGEIENKDMPFSKQESELIKSEATKLIDNVKSDNQIDSETANRFEEKINYVVSKIDKMENRIDWRNILIGTMITEFAGSPQFSVLMFHLKSFLIAIQQFIYHNVIGHSSTGLLN